MATTPYQPNFVMNLPYRNKLPTTAYGPYFKNIDVLSHLKEENPEYRTSTIEKNYIWQPHLGPFVGVDIELVDQESILIADPNAQQNLHPDDRKHLHYSGLEKGKGKAVKASFDQQSKPWWLRNTTYMENNPFNLQKVKEEDPRQRAAELKKKLADPHMDHFSPEYIEKTFSCVEDTIKRLEAQNKHRKLVSVTPVVPLQETNNNNNKTSRKRIHSLVRFDEDPKIVVNVVNDQNNIEQDGESVTKKYKIDDSIVANVREPASSKDGVTNTFKGLEVTLVAPVIKDNENNNDSPTKQSKKVSLNSDEQLLYEWVKDYRMEIHTDEQTCNFVFLVHEERDPTVSANHRPATKVHYFPVASRVDMKKLTLENSSPQDCVVLREDY
jgi:hypothetical protein